MAARQEERAEPAAAGAAGGSERLDLARAIHDRVIQRLFGVSLVLDAAPELTPEDRSRCGREVAGALAALRSVLDEALPAEGGAPLGDVVRCAVDAHPSLPLELDVPPELDLMEAPPLARHFVDEMLRNATRHSRPDRVLVSARRRGRALVLRVENDGALRPTDPPGLGLRLLRLEAPEQGARVNAGPDGAGGWRATLSLPAA